MPKLTEHPLSRPVTIDTAPIDDPDSLDVALRRFTLRKYGLTLDAYEARHAAQDGRCAICGKPETAQREGRTKRLAVDHDGRTGVIRGLLCARCNMALGLFFHNADVLRAAADYLDRFAVHVSEVA